MARRTTLVAGRGEEHHLSCQCGWGTGSRAKEKQAVDWVPAKKREKIGPPLPPKVPFLLVLPRASDKRVQPSMHIRKSIISVCLASAASLLSFPGCVENRSTLYVQRALHVPAGEECVASVDLNTLSSGAMDLALTSSYAVPVVIANQLRPLGDSDRLRTETSHVQLEGFEVTIEGVGDATPSLANYSRRFSAIVQADAGETAGLTPVTLELVPSGAIEETGSYLVHIVVFGTTLGGVSVESPEFVWPLTVCNGCLFTCGDVEDPCIIGNDDPHHCSYYGECNLCQ